MDNAPGRDVTPGTTLSPERTVAPGTRIVIVRHGEAVSNAEEIVAGHLGCQGLTDRGRRQVEALALRLAATCELAGAAALYSSVLPRALETAEILAPVLGGLSITATCELCERHPGVADGLSWAKCDELYGRLLPGDHPEQPLSPGGESWAGFIERAALALVDVALSNPGGLVVIAGHGGIVDASMIRLLEIPDKGGRVRLHPDNSSLTEWAYTGERWWLVRFNDAAHLDPAQGYTRESLRIPPPQGVTSSAG